MSTFHLELKMLSSLETGEHADIYTAGHMMLRLCLMMGAEISTAYKVAGTFIEGLIREKEQVKAEKLMEAK